MDHQPGLFEFDAWPPAVQGYADDASFQPPWPTADEMSMLADRARS